MREGHKESRESEIRLFPRHKLRGRRNRATIFVFNIHLGPMERGIPPTLHDRFRRAGPSPPSEFQTTIVYTHAAKVCRKLPSSRAV